MTHPFAFVPNRSGTNDMKAGDRVIYLLDGRRGVADEFLQAGDTYVTWDDGTFGNVKWRLLMKEPSAQGRTKIFIRAHLPPELQQKWLQHVRDFDVANPGCHFEVMMDTPETSLQDAIDKLQVEPALTFSKIFERKT